MTFALKDELSQSSLRQNCLSKAHLHRSKYRNRRVCGESEAGVLGVWWRIKNYGIVSEICVACG